MKPVMNENHSKRKQEQAKTWVQILADQFGGMTGDTVDKIKKRKKKLEDL